MLVTFFVAQRIGWARSLLGMAISCPPWWWSHNATSFAQWKRRHMIFHCFAVVTALCGQSILASPYPDGAPPMLLRPVTLSVPVVQVTISTQVLVAALLLACSIAAILAKPPSPIELFDKSMLSMYTEVLRRVSKPICFSNQAQNPAIESSPMRRCWSEIATREAFGPRH